LCYITLLCLASASADQGIIKACKEDSIISLTHLHSNPYDDDNEYNRAVGCLKRFSDNEMITINKSGDVTINAFIKRQSINLSGYERVKRYRENKKKDKQVESLFDNTKDDNNDNIIKGYQDNLDKIRVDKIRLDKNNTIADIIKLFETLDPKNKKSLWK
jgi:hypothetical protein